MLEENQLNIIITVATFLSAISLGLVNTLDSECESIGCDLLNITLSVTNFCWLSSLIVSAHIILNKDQNIKNHKICLVLFSSGFLVTLLYILLSGLYRIIYTTNLYLGIVNLTNLSILLIIILVIRSNYVNSKK